MSLFVGANHTSSGPSSLREDRILEALFSFRNDIIEEILKLKQLLISSVLQNKMFERAQSNSGAQQQQLAVLLSEILRGKIGESMSRLPSDDTEEFHDVTDDHPSSSVLTDESSAEISQEKEVDPDAATTDDVVVTGNVLLKSIDHGKKLMPTENIVSVKPEVSESLSWKVDTIANTKSSAVNSRVLPVSILAETGEPLSETDFMHWSDANPEFQELPTVTSNGKLSFPCGECGKVFAYKSGLEKHYRIHTGVRPYKCKLCGKSFAQKGSLKYHIDIHTGQKRHKCSVCGKSFVHKGNLNYHVKTHHNAKVPHSSIPTSTQQTSLGPNWNDAAVADLQQHF